MVRMIISLPEPLKGKLDALRTQGYTASGFIRALLERELADKHPETQSLEVTHVHDNGKQNGKE